jgi:hypothetical protein
MDASARADRRQNIINANLVKATGEIIPKADLRGFFAT